MRKSFTLIETIVVVAVIGLILPVTFAIIFSLINQQVKIYRLSQIKREGDYLINIMENTIRNNAISVHSAKPADDTNIICKNIGSSSSNVNLYFLDKMGKWFGYEGGSNTIASASAFSSINLTSSKILASNISFSCSRTTSYSLPLVSVSFNLCFDTGAGVCTSTRPEETASIYYQTRIKLRSY